jgi:hypothetical protein
MSGRSRFLLILVFAAVLGVALALFGLLLLIGAIGDRHSLGTSAMWVDIVTGAVSLGCAALCGRWIMHLEHRARGHAPGKIAVDVSRAPRALPRSWRSPRRRRYSPVANVTFGLLLLALAIGCIVDTVSLHGQGARSSFVQAHGAPRIGVIISVDNIEHKGRESWWTAKVVLTLDVPVKGQSTTTAYLPYATSATDGMLTTVLVDPRQPGYAEVRGEPYVTAGQWIGGLVTAIIFGATDCLLIWAAVKTYRRRHAWRAMTASASPAVPS